MFHQSIDQLMSTPYIATTDSAEDDQEETRRILVSGDNIVFNLDQIVDKKAPTNNAIRENFQHVYVNAIHFLGLSPDFRRLTEEQLNILIQLIDIYSLDKNIDKMFLLHERVLMAKTTLHFETKSSLLGSYTREGIYHTIYINTDAFLNAFTHELPGPFNVCGYQCSNRLEAIIHTIEHELTHLLVSTNWSAAEGHGKEFLAVAKSLFGHTECRHQFPLPPSKVSQVWGSSWESSSSNFFTVNTVNPEPVSMDDDLNKYFS